MAEIRYAAFISYSHKDGAVARWLHRRLESYGLPRGAAPGYGRKGVFGRRIGRVFRDREELPAGYPLTAKINEALAASDALIVLCSPNAARSEYVNKEILEFQRLGKGDRIFPVIVAGEDHEIFPAALSDKREVLEADMRPGKDGRDHATLKLLAGLMRLEPNDLTRREARAQQRRLALAGAGMAVFAGLAVAAGWFGYQSQRNAETARETLHRFFVVNGERALAEGRPRLAMRYALAGRVLSPANGPEFETLLANALLKAGSTTTLGKVSGDVRELMLSADGAQLASLSSDGQACTIELVSHRTQCRKIAGIGDESEARLLARRNMIVAVERGGRVGVIDLARMSETLTPVIPGVDAVSAFDVAADGVTVAIAVKTTAGANRIYVCRLQASCEGAAIPEEQEEVTSVVSFSPDGGRLASASWDGALVFWDVASMQPLGDVRRDVSLRISSLAWSPDGDRLVTGGSADELGGVLTIWDMRTYRTINRNLMQQDGGVYAIAFSSDGKRIGSWGSTLDGGGSVAYWDAAGGQGIGEPVTTRSRAVAISRSGDRFYWVATDGSMREWRAYSGPAGLRLIDHVDDVLSIAFADAGRRLLGLDAAGRLRGWDSSTGVELSARTVRLPPGHMTQMLLSPGGRRLVVDAGVEGIRLWQVETGRPLGPPLAKTLDDVETLGFSANGRLLAVVTSSEGVQLWDAESGVRINQLQVADFQRFSAIAPLSTHQVLFGGMADSWSPWDGIVRRTPVGGPRHDSGLFSGHRDAVVAIYPAIDEAEIASFSLDGTARIWSAASGRQLGDAVVTNIADSYAAAFAPDGGRLAWIDKVGQLMVFDTGPLTRSWAVNARMACLEVLEPWGRTFTSAEIQADPLLAAEWNDPEQDVCVGVSPPRDQKETS